MFVYLVLFNVVTLFGVFVAALHFAKKNQTVLQRNKEYKATQLIQKRLALKASSLSPSEKVEKLTKLDIEMSDFLSNQSKSELRDGEKIIVLADRFREVKEVATKAGN